MKKKKTMKCVRTKTATCTQQLHNHKKLARIFIVCGGGGRRRKEEEGGGEGGGGGGGGGGGTQKNRERKVTKINQ